MTAKPVRVVLVLWALAAVAARGLEWQAVLSIEGRCLARMVVDTAGHRAVMFGGGTSYDQYNDVWELPLDTTAGYSWHPVRTSGPTPAGRHGHAVIYDPVGQRMIVFGGRVLGSPGNDLWSLDLTTHTWQQLTPSGPIPEPRTYISAIYHPLRHSMITFDGTGLSTAYDDVWELMLDSMKWRQLLPSGQHPTARWSYALEFDPDSNRMIAIAGEDLNGQFCNDVWALSLVPGSEQWTRLNPSGTIPSGRSGPSWCYDPVGRKYFIFGGYTFPPFRFYNDLHVLDLVSLTWTRLWPTNVPAERRGAAGSFDPFSHNFLIFGGETDYGYDNDAYYVNVDSLGVVEWQPTSPRRPGVLLHLSAVNTRPVRFRYALAEPGDVQIRIMDPTGRVVRRLFNGRSETGGGRVTWDGRCDDGRLAPGGSYFCYLETEKDGTSRKFVLTE